MGTLVTFVLGGGGGGGGGEGVVGDRVFVRLAYFVMGYFYFLIPALV